MTLTLTDALMPRGSYRDVFTEPQRADALLELVKAGWPSFMFQVDFPGQATSCVSLGLTASLRLKRCRRRQRKECGQSAVGKLGQGGRCGGMFGRKTKRHRQVEPGGRHPESKRAQEKISSHSPW